MTQVDLNSRIWETAARLNATMTEWGGKREGAGRPSAFGHKAAIAYMDLTPVGRALLDEITRHTKLSRNDVMSHLSVTYADKLKFDEPGVVYAGKLNANVLLIRLTKAAGKKLYAARDRTEKSFSDLGEALLRTYGEKAEYPEPPLTKAMQRQLESKKRRRRNARKAR